MFNSGNLVASRQWVSASYFLRKPDVVFQCSFDHVCSEFDHTFRLRFGNTFLNLGSFVHVCVWKKYV